MSDIARVVKQSDGSFQYHFEGVIPAPEKCPLSGTGKTKNALASGREKQVVLDTDGKTPLVSVQMTKNLLLSWEITDPLEKARAITAQLELKKAQDALKASK